MTRKADNFFCIVLLQVNMALDWPNTSHVKLSEAIAHSIRTPEKLLFEKLAVRASYIRCTCAPYL